MNTQFDYNEFMYDGREISEESVSWKDIKIGDVVIEGFLNSKLCEYITLTNVDTSDYEVSYKDNVNVGEATVTIVGKNNYAGTLTRTFNITPKEIEVDLGSYITIL